jgi:RNA polymerase sigma-70 factor (ECF subfamily)
MTRAPLTDAQLVARCRAGDEAAWAALVERFARYVYAICAQGFRFAEHDAEDVFQDVFAKTYQQLGRLRDDDAIRPWLAQLTRRTCIDHLRATARESPVEDVEPGGVDDLLERLDDAMAVRQALAQVGEPCAEMLDRFFAQDQSYRTIAEELGLPPGTVASRLSRCLEKLRTTMDGRFAGSRPS